jgi:hypothetical protein
VVGGSFTDLIRRFSNRHYCVWIHSTALAQFSDRSTSHLVACPIHEALVDMARELVVIMA